MTESSTPDPTPEGATPPPPPEAQPPAYGQPPAAYGQPPYAQPQYGQPPYAQPQYGQPQYGQPPQPGYGQPYYAAAPPQAPGQGLYVAAAVINWVVFGLIVVATLGIGIVTAAWFIPMTIRMHKDARDVSKHTALGVCTLLFCNIVSGILILVADGSRQNNR